jgi:hypothetical protein
MSNIVGTDQLTQKLDSLIDRWCERRAIRPLQLLLRAYPGRIIHTDQFHELLDALKDVKGLARSILMSDELADVISCISFLEDALARQS